MDPRPSSQLLLVTSLLLFWLCARVQSSYTIDTVRLTIQPGHTVQSGTPVTLRCDVNVIHNNIPHLTHTFQLTRDNKPIHTSSTPEDSVTLVFNPARAADSGHYECRVTVKEKSKTTIAQKLDVIGLQTPLLYLNKTDPYESEEFTAICSAPEEKGNLRFRFYRRFRTGKSETIKQPASTGNSSEITLALNGVGDSILFCDYEINLVSGARRSNHSNEIQVLVKGLFITPTMNVLPSKKVFEGDVLEVVCKVVTTLKNVEVFLTKDKRILKQGPISITHRFTVHAGDSGELTCKAEWGNVPKETYEIITVQELFSEPQLSVEPTQIFEGDQFKMTCSVTIYHPERINNDTIRFSISKDNVTLTSSETYRGVAGPSKNGNYNCKVQVDSTARRFDKESQTVLIKAKVPVSKPMLSVVGGTLVLGKSFQVLCHSDSGTLPITYILHGPNKLYDHRMVSKPGEQAIFNSSAIHKISDLNNFLCHAKNSQTRPAVIGLGQALLRTTNIIEPVSKTMLTTNPSPEDVSEGEDLHLICSVDRGTLPITFTWYRTDQKDALALQILEKLEGFHKIEKVSGDRAGGYFCVTTNPAKETQRSNTVIVRVKLAAWKKGLIAAFCILLVLVLILVVVFKRHLLQFKRKRTAELSVKSAGTKAERLSLTQAEVDLAANATPCLIGKSVWREHAQSSDESEGSPQDSPKPLQHSEVQIRQADPNTAQVKTGTDIVYSEVRISNQGVPEQADGQGSVEYAQLNHDAHHHSDHGNHGDHAVEIDNSVESDAANQEE